MTKIQTKRISLQQQKEEIYCGRLRHIHTGKEDLIASKANHEDRSETEPTERV
jgi:hypothetical protein